MALSRKMLKAMGIEEEKIEQIIDAHAETVDALKEELANHKASSEELDKTKKALADMQAEMESANKDSWKVKYDAVKEEFDEYKAGIEAKATKAAKEKAYIDLLKATGVAEKRIPAIIKVTDVESIKLDEKGGVIDSDSLQEGIREEWSDFIVSESQKGADTAKPPANNGAKTTMTKEQIMAITDTAERQKAIAEHHELFGF